MSNGLDISKIPIFLQQNIIKKMKLLDVIRLQQTGKHFLNLVDETDTRLLEYFRIVQNTPDRLFDKLPMEENEFQRWREKEMYQAENLASDYSISYEERLQNMSNRFDFQRAVRVVRQRINGIPEVAE